MESGNLECKICRKKTDYLESHHIVPKSRGGSDDESNLINICVECHGLAHDVSFSNNKSGLVKESFDRRKNQIEIDKKWLDDNLDFFHNKMMDLYDCNEDEHMLLLLLMEKGCITSSHIRKWCEKGKMKLKLHLTITDENYYNETYGSK